MSSTADTDDVIEVSADGLTVHKRFAADEFPVPAIRFEIESDHDEPVTFRLSETIPDSFPMDKVGFHPEYYSEDWTAFQDNHVEFTGILEPEESLVTVYGVRIDDETDVTEFLTEPAVVEVSSEEETESDADAIDDDVIETIVSDGGGQAVKDLIAGDADTVPGLEEEGELDLDLDGDADDTAEADEPDIELGFEEDEAADLDDEAEPAADEAVALGGMVEVTDDSKGTDADPSEIDLGLDEVDSDDVESAAGDGDEPKPADGDGDEPETDDDESTVADADSEDDASDEPASTGTDESDVDEPDADETATAPLEGSIGSRLAAEIQDGAIEEDDLEVLRDELDLGPAGSELAKVDHLQSRVEEVAAYTDALERFLDEQGTGEQLIEEFQAELASFEEELAAVDERLDGADSRVDGLETDVESLTDWTADLEDDLGAVEDDVDAVDDRVDDLADDLEAVQDGLTDVQDWRDQLGSMFSDS